MPQQETTIDQILKYIPLKLKGKVVFILLALISTVLIVLSKGFSLDGFSPYLKNLHDVHSIYAWKFAPEALKHPNYLKAYWLFGFSHLLVPILLAYFHLVMCNSKMVVSGNHRERQVDFSLHKIRDHAVGYFIKDKIFWRVLVFILLLICLGLGIAEWSLIEKVKAPSHKLWLLHQWEVWIYALVAIIVLYDILHVYFADNTAFWAEFISSNFAYFIPSLLGIATMYLILANFKQTDTLFVELMGSWGNFLLFSFFLFPFSLASVWYIPYYLKFSYEVYRNLWKKGSPIHESVQNIIPKREDGFSMKWRYYMHAVLPMFFLYRNQKEVKEDIDLITAHVRKTMDAPPEYSQEAVFHVIRRILGVIYILTLIFLVAQTWKNVVPNDTIVPLLMGSAVLLTILYRVSVKQAVKKLRRVGEENNSKKEENYEDRFSTLHVQVSVGIVIAFLLGLFVWLFFHCFTSTWTTLKYYAIFLTVLAPNAFLSAAYYRRFARKYVIPEKSKDSLEKVDKVMTIVIMCYLFGLTALSIISILFILLLGFKGVADFLESTNTLIVFLLLVNGFVGAIAIARRLIRLRHHFLMENARAERKTISRIGPALKIGAGIFGILLVALFFNSKGNSYHSLDYVKNVQETPPSLEDYTRTFLNRNPDSTKPVIFIAAEGGGLRASYWNLLVMDELTKIGCYDQVFLATGVSGGLVGQGMFSALMATGIQESKRTETIHQMGGNNFLSMDFAGLLGRFPIYSLPERVSKNPWSKITYDRMEGLAIQYFEMVNAADSSSNAFSYEILKEKPYFQIWKEQNYQLPLVIPNTSRAEDGVRGVVAPLAKNKALTAGMVDLSSRNITNQEEYISYADAFFLSNRFPALSPAGKVEGKGHFIDGGAVENSGLQTALQFLWYMQCQIEPDSICTNDSICVYKRLFERPIVLLNIRNSQTSYVYNKFQDKEDSLNFIPNRSDPSSIISAGLNSGLTGTSKTWDALLDQGDYQSFFGIDNYACIDLPYRLNNNTPHKVLGGQINDLDIKARVVSNNQKIFETLEEHNYPDTIMLDPPLGRVLAEKTTTYMEIMIHHPEVDSTFKHLRLFENQNQN